MLKMVGRSTSPRPHEPQNIQQPTSNIEHPMMKMVKRAPHPGPLPIGSADSADAEREKRSQRPGEVTRSVVQGFNARILRGILSPLRGETGHEWQVLGSSLAILLERSFYGFLRTVMRC